MHGYGKILEKAYFISDRDDYASPGLLGPRNFIRKSKNIFFEFKIKLKFFSEVFKYDLKSWNLIVPAYNRPASKHLALKIR